MKHRTHSLISSSYRSLAGLVALTLGACGGGTETADSSTGPVDAGSTAEVTLPDGGGADAMPGDAAPAADTTPADSADPAGETTTGDDATAPGDADGPTDTATTEDTATTGDTAATGDTTPPSDTAADPCAPNPCVDPPLPCDGTRLTRYQRVGVCAARGAEATCDYPALETVDCAATGQRCDDATAACVTPPLRATSFSPDPAAPVALDARLLIGFSHPLDPATATSQAASGPCEGTFQLSLDDFASCLGLTATMVGEDGRSVELKPGRPLTGGLRYALRVTTELASRDGASRLGEAAVQPFTAAEALACGPTDGPAVVVSQLYGGGGNSGAALRNDFVELHNRSGAPVALDGWSLQYASAEGDAWSNSSNVPTALTGLIPPGGYFLVQLASSGATGAELPAPDQTGRLNLANASGKLALVKGTTPLPPGACPPADRLIDLVAYGASATVCGGEVRSANLSASLAAHRDVGGCLDADRAAEDFIIAAPGPRNSASTPVACACASAPPQNGQAGSVAFCNLQHPPTLGAPAGSEAGPVYGRLFHPGRTDATVGGPATGVVAQLGFGRAGSDPRVGRGWAWLAGRFNVEAGAAGHDDEYMASLPVPRAPDGATYSYTWRVSLDEGRTWTYCDRSGAGSNAGLDFDPTDLGVLTVGGSPCLPNPCTSPPDDLSCTGEAVSGWESTGTCALVDGAASCRYAPRVVEDCEAGGGVCEGGSCVECRDDAGCDAPFGRCVEQACEAICSEDLFAGNHTRDDAASVDEDSASWQGLVLCPSTPDYFRLKVPSGATLRVLVAFDAERELVGAELSEASPEAATLASAEPVTGGVQLVWTAREDTDVVLLVTDGGGVRGNVYDLTISTSLNPCVPNPCLRPDAAFCEGDAIVTPAAEGRCTTETAPFACDYLADATTEPCAHGCKVVDGAPDACEPPPPLAVVSTTPAEGDVEVAPGRELTVTFNQPIDGATATTAGADGACSGTIALSYGGFTGETCLGFAPLSGASLSDDRRTLTLRPARPLPLGLPLALRIGTGLRGASGSALAADVKVSFQTARPARCGGGLVVMSQLYGGGGNAGALWKNDFVELHNRGTAPVNLRGWSLQYASATGATWTNVLPLTGFIRPGGFHLVQLAAGAGEAASLPTPDETGGLAMSGTAGKVALVTGVAPLTSACPSGDSRVVDFVGWGGANCQEGSATAPATTNPTAVHRDVGGCSDLGQNGIDYLLAAPAPRNAATPPVMCGCRSEAQNGEGAPAEAAYCALLGPSPLWVEPGAYSAAVTAELQQPGVTDVAAGPDPRVRAEVGFGRLPATPDAEAVWAFSTASFQSETSVDAVGETWTGKFAAPPAAMGARYAVAARFSLDGGDSWTWCDLNGAGHWPGHALSPDALGELVLGADLCAPNPCTAPEGEPACDGERVVAPAKPGLCKTDGRTFTCDYSRLETVADCARDGRYCADATCVGCREGSHCSSGVCNPDGTCADAPNPCEPNPCTDAPLDRRCVGDQVWASLEPGSCMAVGDSYTCEYQNSGVVEDCASDGRFCEAGACVRCRDTGDCDSGLVCDEQSGTCVDPTPCEPNPCTEVSDQPFCAGDSVVVRDNPGTCTADGSRAVCDYASTTTLASCGDRGQFCLDAACVGCRSHSDCRTGEVCDTETFTCRPGDVCSPNPCTTPPTRTSCEGEKVVRAASPGVCSAEAAVNGFSCDYPTLEVARDCQADGLLCSEGACVECRSNMDCGAGNCDTASGRCVQDPCSPNPCTEAPAAYCDSVTLVTPAREGACEARAGGTPTCDYLAAARRETCANGCLPADGTNPARCAPEPLSVTSATPRGSAVDVPARAPITLTFNKPVDLASLLAQSADGDCSGALQLSFNEFGAKGCVAIDAAATAVSDEGRALTFQPVGPLSLGVRWSVRVTTAARGADGTTLAAEFRSSFTTAAPSRCGGGLVVMSQVYGAGGLSGSAFKNDFVELHNRSAEPVSLRGWSLQYASATGTSWAASPLSGVMAPGAFALVQLQGGSNGADLPAADVVVPGDIAGTSGKLALVAGLSALPAATCPEAARTVDFLAYGTNATLCGTSERTAMLGGALAAHRDVGGCRDEGSAAVDFAVLAPAPRNAGSSPVLCGCRSEARNGAGKPSEVASCSLVRPSRLFAASGAVTAVVTGSVTQPGATDATSGGPAAGVTMQVGYGLVPAGETDTAWAFFPASDFVAEQGDRGEADVWRGTMTAPMVPAGRSYAFTARASVDGGATWTWCDLDGAGAYAGLSFKTDQLGLLSIGEDRCAQNPCTSPPTGSACSGEVVTRPASPGLCQTDGVSFTCSYDAAETVKDCAAIGQVCAGGACVECRDGSQCRSGVCNPDNTCAPLVDPCAPNPCQRDARTYCDGANLVTELPTGTCTVDPTVRDGYTCRYEQGSRTCASFCEEGACTDWRFPSRPGDLVMTELMQLPTSLAGEYVEVVNPTPARLNLRGLILSTEPPHAVEEDLFVNPGGVLVFGATTDRTLNGGAPVSHAWTEGASLPFDGPLLLTHVVEVIDAVDADPAAGFPYKLGEAIGLNPLSAQPGAALHLVNDDGTAWCLQSSRFGPGEDRGTPGAMNDACEAGPRPFSLASSQPSDGAREVPPSTPIALTFTAAVDPRSIPASVPAGRCQSPFAVSVDAFVSCLALTASVDAREPTRVTLQPAEPLPPESLVSVRVGVTIASTSGASPLEAVTFGFTTASAASSACAPNPCVRRPESICVDDVLVTDAAEGVCSLSTVDPAGYTCRWPEVTEKRCPVFCEAGACTDWRAPRAKGEVVITEIMAEPTSPLGQYVELLNPTSAHLNLRGLEITSLFGSFAIDADLFVGPDQTVVLGASQDRGFNGGAPVAYAWPEDFWLSPEDFLALDLGRATIDEVIFDALGGFPSKEGSAIGLDASRLLEGDALDGVNDDGSYWCVQTSRFGPGPDRGTPGARNDSCGLVTTFSVLSTEPSDGDIEVATSRTIAALFSSELDAASLPPKDDGGPCRGPVQLSADGFLTCLAIAISLDPDQPARLLIRPQTLMPAAALMKVRLAAGIASTDGQLLAEAVTFSFQTTAAADPCRPNPCGPAPVEPVCLGDKVVQQSGDGVCVAEPRGGFRCDYASRELEDCASVDQLCSGGACVECQEDLDCEPGTCDRREGVCVYPAWDVRWCRLQWPLELSLPPLGTAEVYGRVYIPGLTDVDRSGNDLDPYGQVLAQVGYGPKGSLPDASWVWEPGTPNPDYVVEGNPGGSEPDNDEYRAALKAPSAAGGHDFAFRFSGDGGLTWLLCDRDGAAPSGREPLDYSALQAGKLVVRTPVEVRETLYQQNFDGLFGATVTMSGFMERLPGWVLRNTTSTVVVSNGNQSTGGIHSFGATGAPDRGLGGQASGGTGVQHWGFCWTNQTAHTWADLRVSFVGEQWRNGGTPSGGVAAPHALSSSWTRSGTGNAITPGLNATNIAGGVSSDPRTGWVRVPELTFTSPIFGGTAAALDGNAAAQRLTLAHRFGAVTLAPGETVCFRWEDLDDAGADHGLGIDDLILEGFRVE